MDMLVSALEVLGLSLCGPMALAEQPLSGSAACPVSVLAFRALCPWSPLGSRSGACSRVGALPPTTLHLSPGSFGLREVCFSIAFFGVGGLLAGMSWGGQLGLGSALCLATVWGRVLYGEPSGH